jgi:hypothetical protein
VGFQDRDEKQPALNVDKGILKGVSLHMDGQKQHRIFFSVPKMAYLRVWFTEPQYMYVCVYGEREIERD